MNDLTSLSTLEAYVAEIAPFSVRNVRSLKMPCVDTMKSENDIRSLSKTKSQESSIKTMGENVFRPLQKDCEDRQSNDTNRSRYDRNRGHPLPFHSDHAEQIALHMNTLGKREFVMGELQTEKDGIKESFIMSCAKNGAIVLLTASLEECDGFSILIHRNPRPMKIQSNITTANNDESGISLLSVEYCLC